MWCLSPSLSLKISYKLNAFSILTNIYLLCDNNLYGLRFVLQFDSKTNIHSLSFITSR